MNIKDLYYFQRLISTQSYTQTAADFHVSQPQSPKQLND
ncbi:hypothetical protein Nizo1840_1966 [Lactiplantibacillus plantarum]|nr:hypothetical protein Nizo1840_1966 [Lactiplantibacillus plantarum]